MAFKWRVDGADGNASTLHTHANAEQSASSSINATNGCAHHTLTYESAYVLEDYVRVSSEAQIESISLATLHTIVPQKQWKCLNWPQNN